MYINTQHFFFLLKWKKYEYSSSFIFQGITGPAGTSVGFDQFPSPLQKWQLSLSGPDRGLPNAQEVLRGGSLRPFPAVHKHSLTEENIQRNLCENF